ncbi:MAG: PD40 domain-containing protein [Anaerolineae bacterium]|nr:PD40 domain-containing protein [Anaerolineae bacterium]
MPQKSDKELEDQLAGLFSSIDQLPKAVPSRSPAPGTPQPVKRDLKKPPDPFALQLDRQPVPLAPEATVALKPARPGPMLSAPPVRRGVNWRLVVWTVIATIVAGVVYGYGQAFFNPTPPEETPVAARGGLVQPSATAVAKPSATPTSLPMELLTITEPTATPTSIPGGRAIQFSAGARNSGWVASDDPSIVTEFDPPNHFGDSFLYAGRWNGQTFYGAFQFDLSQIPRGTTVEAASLRLTGLVPEGAETNPDLPWQLQLLAPDIDLHWRDHNFDLINQAETILSLTPTEIIDQADGKRIYQFDFGAPVLAAIERRLIEGGDNFGRKLSFRLDGPLEEQDFLLRWAGDGGPTENGSGPTLFLNLGPTPKSTPPPYYVVVTSTPTPLTVETAAAISIQQTASAKTSGTATPLPPNWITPIVVTATPVPQNEATVAANGRLATAIAVTTGQPPNLMLATATPTFVIITSTPTPLTLETAAAQAAQAKALAQSQGTATPFPANWVTPAVVIDTPTPENTATALYYQALALTTGTPTPTPANVQTATPTPVSRLATLVVPPTATITPSPTFQPMPAELVNKIIFLTDREGATAEERALAGQRNALPQVVPQPYIYDPATEQLEQLSSMWPYQAAALRDSWTADQRYQTYNQKLLWANIDNKAIDRYAIFVYDFEFHVTNQVTNFGAGDAWDPVWSPSSDKLALVSNDSADDEIWVVNRDGSDLKRLTETNEAYNAQFIGKDNFIPEVNGHPSWSPDGSQLVFWSNRSGNRQIWIMNADGSNQRLLMPPNPYNDWDPVWIKYTNPPSSQRR